MRSIFTFTIAVLILTACSQTSASSTSTPLPSTIPTHTSTVTPTFLPTFTPTPSIDPDLRVCTEGLCQSRNDGIIPIYDGKTLVRNVESSINPDAIPELVKTGQDIVWLIDTLNTIQHGGQYISPEEWYKKHPDGTLDHSLTLEKTKDATEGGTGLIASNNIPSNFNNITYNFAQAGERGNRAAMGGANVSVIPDGNNGYVITISPMLTRHIEGIEKSFINNTLTDEECRVQMSRAMALLSEIVDQYTAKPASFFAINEGIILRSRSGKDSDPAQMIMDEIYESVGMLTPADDTKYVK